MKSRTAVCAIAIAAMGLGSSTYAQSHRSNGERPDGPRHEGRDNRSGHDGRRPIQRIDQGERHGDRGPRDIRQHGRPGQWQHAEDGRWSERWRPGGGGPSRVYGPRVYNHGPQVYNYGARGPQFRTGVAIPVQYRSYSYVVNNWHDHRLHAPRRGQQWVQVGADYALIAIATGVIVHLVLSQ